VAAATMLSEVIGYNAIALRRKGFIAVEVP
jgi:hypothetical protein